MARPSIALFLASAGLIAGLSGCGGEGPSERPDGPSESPKPSLGAPQGGEGGEGGEGEEREQKKPAADSEGGEGGEGGEG